MARGSVADFGRSTACRQTVAWSGDSTIWKNTRTGGRLFALELRTPDVLRAVLFLGIGDAYANSPLHPAMNRAGAPRALENVRVILLVEAEN